MRRMTRSRTPDVYAMLGYTFRQPHLLEEALTHKSHVNEAKEKRRRHNERLEFVGDAVLALVISEHLAATYPDANEGELSKLKAQLVSESTLAGVAKRLGLGELLKLGRGEELTRGRQKTSLLADAMEAVLAAVYLDGGLDSVRELTLRAFQPEFQDVKNRLEGDNSIDTLDYKTQLQEWCQKRFEGLPQYVTVRETGPDHQKTFEVQLLIQGDVVGLGEGRSKKEAEQMAAKQGLRHVIEYDD